MALAKLCHDATRRHSSMAPLFGLPDYPSPLDVSFTAFIVDHKIRKHSGREATQVAAELKKLDIESEILELDWSSYGDPASLSDLESVARKLRYQVLGRACASRSITSLLVAHHRNDQVETALGRVLTNYMGIGLGGMRLYAPIPECSGIHGVDQSGSYDQSFDPASQTHARVAIERGGVYLGRPLLAFSKRQLIGICRQNGVLWFEDHTNADRQFTLRNTVRFLLASGDLPKALRSERLSSLAANAGTKRHRSEKEADQVFADMKVKLQTSIGTATIQFPSSSLKFGSSGDNRTHTLRRMLQLVSPKDQLELGRVVSGVDNVFQTHNTDTKNRPLSPASSCINLSGVSIERHATKRIAKSETTLLTLRRALPTAAERSASGLQMWPVSAKDAINGPHSRWQLWDGRYWIRILPPETNHESYREIYVRFLHQDDLAGIKASIEPEEDRRLAKTLKLAKGKIRFTLPAIAVRPESESRDATTEYVVALPSLNWSVSGWSRFTSTSSGVGWQWDIRYKHVQLHSAAHQDEKFA